MQVWSGIRGRDSRRFFSRIAGDPGTHTSSEDVGLRPARLYYPIRSAVGDPDSCPLRCQGSDLRPHVAQPAIVAAVWSSR